MAVAGVGCDCDIAAIAKLMKLDAMAAAGSVHQGQDWAKALAAHNAECMTS